MLRGYFYLNFEIEIPFGFFVLEMKFQRTLEMFVIDFNLLLYIFTFCYNFEGIARSYFALLDI